MTDREKLLVSLLSADSYEIDRRVSLMEVVAMLEELGVEYRRRRVAVQSRRPAKSSRSRARTRTKTPTKQRRRSTAAVK